LASGCGSDGPSVSEECGFAARYLPYELGYSWTYNVTDLGSGVRTTKTQTLSSALVESPDLPGEMFIEQTTVKATGTTVSLLRVDGDVLNRYRQEDFDDLGVSERVTIYEPAKVRLDETADRLETGAAYTEAYTATITDSTGSVPTSISEDWEVINSAVECTSPLGTFECLQIRRTRTLGGLATKDFYFAEGVGKVREEGATQLEEVASCAAPE